MIALVGPLPAVGPAQVASIDYAAIAPLLVVFGAAVLGVLVEAFAPRAARHTTQLIVTLGGLVAAFVTVAAYAAKHQARTMGVLETSPTGATSVSSPALVIDGPALFLQGLIIVLGILGTLTMAERYGGTTSDTFTAMGAASPGSPTEEAALRAGRLTSEVYPILLFAVGGMMIFPAAGDLITMFVALEVLSLPLYILTGLARRKRLLSQEAALKYFLLGAFSSAFYLFGAALLYGYAGSVHLDVIAQAISAPNAGREPLLITGVILVLVGLLFKVGAAPFHAWTPDVYQGAPTPVTGFMAAATKAAAFGAILRFLYMGVAGALWDWQPIVVAIAVLTMVVGAVVSVVQTDLKRLLAYSSIAHAGFILVGVLAMDRTGVAGVLFYLVAYGFATIAAFGIISLVREVDTGSEATKLSQWAGLGRRHPVVAGVFAFLLLSFAGIPLTSGFVAKFAVFAAAIGHGGATGTTLAIIGVLCSAITVYVYFRIIIVMYFGDRGGLAAAGAGPAAVDGGEVDTVALTPSALTTFAIAIGTLVTIVLGIVPGTLLDLVERCSQFIR